MCPGIRVGRTTIGLGSSLLPYWTPRYFVDSVDGLDSNDGLSADTAWKTVAKVNASSFVAGDKIGFKKDGVWRETLIVPSSGESGNPITFGVYPNGNAYLKITDVVDTWAADDYAWQSGFDPTYSSALSSEANSNVRNVIPANTASSGTKIRISIKATNGQATVNGASIGVMTTNGVFDLAPTRITFNTGSSSVVINSGDTVVSDEIDFIFDGTKRHGVHIFAANRQYLSYNNPALGQRYFYDPKADQSMVENGGAGGVTNGSMQFDLLEIAGKVDDCYNSTFTVSPPYKVFKNGTLLTRSATKAGLNNNEWYGVAGTLSIKDISGSPTVIEASARHHPLSTNGKGNLVVRDGISAYYDSQLRFMNNYLTDFLVGNFECTSLISDDGNKIELWVGPGVYHYSTDGQTWSAGQLVMIDGVHNDLYYQHAFKVGSTYYLSCKISGETDGIRLHSGTDGINFTTIGAIIPYGTAGAWDDDGIFNHFIWTENGNWYCLYEGGYPFKIGLATASNVAGPWTKHASNPVINIEGVGNPEMFRVNNEIIKNDGKYYIFVPRNSTDINTAISRYSSTDLVTWTNEGVFNFPSFRQGVGYDYSDQCFVQFKGKTYMIFGVSDQQGFLEVDMCMDNRTMAELLALTP